MPIQSIARIVAAVVGLGSLQGCALAIRHEIGNTKVALAYSVSCHGLININPEYHAVIGRLTRFGPVALVDKATDTQVPTPAEAALAAEIGLKRQACEQQEADAMQPVAPKIAAVLRNDIAAQAAVYVNLGARQLLWAEARRQLWYLHDATAIQLIPLLTEFNEHNRERLETAAMTDRLLGAVLVGGAAGATAGAVAYQPRTHTAARFR